MDLLSNFLFGPKVEINFDKLPAAPILEERDAVALFEYQHPMVKSLVWQIKYKGDKHLARKAGERMREALLAELEERGLWGESSAIILAPIPISAEKLFERGFNQAELLVKNMKGFEYLNILEKIQKTKTQKDAGGRAARLKNLKNSMRVRGGEKVGGKTVVVIDDVTTTGATFAEAKRALREASVKRIICLALAH